jgi:hypothetical protein
MPLCDSRHFTRLVNDARGRLTIAARATRFAPLRTELTIRACHLPSHGPVAYPHAEKTKLSNRLGPRAFWFLRDQRSPLRIAACFSHTLEHPSQRFSKQGFKQIPHARYQKFRHMCQFFDLGA